jgi:uncharacterized membrane protein
MSPARVGGPSSSEPADGAEAGGATARLGLRYAGQDRRRHPAASVPYLEEPVAVGPCDLLVIKFPGNNFKGEIAPALGRLVEAKTIKILDILFAIKDENGEVAILEVKDIDGDGVADIVAIAEFDGAIGPDDVDDAAQLLEPNSSALLLLFENTWAAEVTQAMRNADGELLYMERIPAAVVEEALAAVAAEA